MENSTSRYEFYKSLVVRCLVGALAAAVVVATLSPLVLGDMYVTRGLIRVEDDYRYLIDAKKINNQEFGNLSAKNGLAVKDIFEKRAVNGLDLSGCSDISIAPWEDYVIMTPNRINPNILYVTVIQDTAIKSKNCFDDLLFKVCQLRSAELNRAKKELEQYSQALTLDLSSKCVATSGNGDTTHCDFGEQDHYKIELLERIQFGLALSLESYAMHQGPQERIPGYKVLWKSIFAAWLLGVVIFFALGRRR